MQNGNSDKSGDIEPDGHIQVSFPSFNNSSKHVPAKHHPYKRNSYVDGPFQFSIFLACCKSKGQCQYSRKYNELPAPEMYFAQLIAKHAGLAESLQRIIHAHKNTI